MIASIAFFILSLYFLPIYVASWVIWWAYREFLEKFPHDYVMRFTQPEIFIGTLSSLIIVFLLARAVGLKGTIPNIFGLISLFTED